MKRDDQKKKEPEGLLGAPGPVRLGSGQQADKHLFTKTGSPGYTEGVPYEEEKYVTEVIGGDYKVPTDTPSSVKSGVTVPHMGVEETPPISTKPHGRPAYEPPSALLEKRPSSISPSAKIDPWAIIIGNVKVEENVCVAAGAVISGHEEEPIVLSRGCGIFEGAVLTVLPVRPDGRKVTSRLVNVAGSEYPLFVGEESAIAPGAKLTGPCYIGRRCFVGPGAQVFWAKVGDGVIIEPGAFVMNVEVPSGYFVPAGVKLTARENVAKLPKITDRYRFRGLAAEMLAEISKRR